MPLINHFKHINLTGGQRKALDEIEGFLHGDKDIFILKGYAGTGKTTLLKGIISYLSAGGFQNFSDWEIYNSEWSEKTFRVMAPTGRAAKIIKDKTGFNATTIHAAIYNFDTLHTEEFKGSNAKTNDDSQRFVFYFSLADIRPSNAVILVDEASMISDKLNENNFLRFGSGHLLRDLIDYAGFHLKGNKPKIIFIGDPAQLPPVNMNFSPALDENYLSEKYGLHVSSFELNEVMRQDESGGILSTANEVRKNLIPYHFRFFRVPPNGKDIFDFSENDFYKVYSNLKDKIIITYTNETADALNRYIRKERYKYDGKKNLPVWKDDIVLVVTNNYKHQVLNGEFGVVREVSDVFRKKEIPLKIKGGKEVKVLLKWRKVKIFFDENKTVEGTMLDSLLKSKNSELSDIERQALFVEFKMRHKNLAPQSEEFRKALKNDEFFNALQIKYGYAVTCHKAQGGEWNNVFVFFDDFSQNMRSNFFYRWSYTAITRATQKLFAYKSPYFHSFSDMDFKDVSIQDNYPINVIKINAEHQKLIRKLNAEKLPVKLQNHIIKMYELLREKEIELAFYNLMNYEIHGGFIKESKKVVVKFWRNHDNTILDKFEKVSVHTTSDLLFDTIVRELKKIPRMAVESGDGVHKNLSGIYKFDPEIARKKPVLKTLYERLMLFLPDFGIKIKQIDHLSYIERYAFIRHYETAVVDFVYNDNAFFGSVIPLPKRCNSSKLLGDLKQIVEKIKQ